MTALATAAAIVSMIAGHPTQVVCDVPTTDIANGWTHVGGNVIHLRPTLCDDLALPPREYAFGKGLGILLHEAAHARGVRSEACAEMYANILVYQVLHDYYNVPFFSEVSWAVASTVRASRPFPEEYRWTTTSCDAEP